MPSTYIYTSFIIDLVLFDRLLYWPHIAWVCCHRYETESTISGPWCSIGTRHSPDFLHSCEIKAASGLGTRLYQGHIDWMKVVVWKAYSELWAMPMAHSTDKVLLLPTIFHLDDLLKLFYAILLYLFLVLAWCGIFWHKYTMVYLKECIWQPYLDFNIYIAGWVCELHALAPFLVKIMKYSIFCSSKVRHLDGCWPTNWDKAAFFQQWWNIFPDLPCSRYRWKGLVHSSYRWVPLCVCH